MLFITLQKQNDKYFLQFELENYFRDLHRATYIRGRLPGGELKTALKDGEYLKETGLWVMMGLLDVKAHNANEGACLFAFLEENPRTLVLNEKYHEPFRQRKLIDTMPVPSTNINDLNDAFLQDVTKKICTLFTAHGFQEAA